MVGSGYVGLVSGTCLSAIGHEVTCVDIDKNKIAKLQDGISPIYEPGLDRLIRQNQENERLDFSTNLKETLAGTEVVFIAVGTPQGEDGSADLKYVMSVASEIGKSADHKLLVVVKSTVPVGSCEKVQEIINGELEKRKVNFKITVASNPEFLKEGSAIADFMKPDRIVVGTINKEDGETLKKLYFPFILDDPNKILVVERSASEMIKYTSNAMLATRISFMNDLSLLCEKLGVNIDQVRIGMGSDTRVGKKFLYSGPGYGGSCFPKDVAALVRTGAENDVELKILNAVTEVNETQKNRAFQKVKNYFGNLSGKKIAIWGLSFKPGTDDVREAPSLTIVKNLLNEGAEVVAHDPQAEEEFLREMGADADKVKTVKLAYDALKDANALVLLTEWSEYKWPNWNKVSDLLKDKVIFDLRNQYHKNEIVGMGFHYECIGRPDSRSDLKKQK